MKRDIFILCFKSHITYRYMRSSKVLGFFLVIRLLKNDTDTQTGFRYFQFMKNTLENVQCNFHNTVFH